MNPATIITIVSGSLGLLYNYGPKMLAGIKQIIATISSKSGPTDAQMKADYADATAADDAIQAAAKANTGS